MTVTLNDVDVKNLKILIGYMSNGAGGWGPIRDVHEYKHIQ